MQLYIERFFGDPNSLVLYYLSLVYLN